MANKLQRILFNLSTVSPISFFISVVWWIQHGSDELLMEAGKCHITAKAIIISIIGIVGFMYAFYSVMVVKVSIRKLQIVPINVSSVKSTDKKSIVGIITYILPFSNLVLKDYDFWLSIFVLSLAILFVFLSNTVWPNPILILWRYHFYEISTANGSEELPLISTRRSIQNAKTIEKVITLWDYFTIEVKQ